MARKFNELRKGLELRKLREAKLGLLYQTKSGPPAAQSYRQYIPEIWPPYAIFGKLPWHDAMGHKYTGQAKINAWQPYDDPDYDE